MVVTIRRPLIFALIVNLANLLFVVAAMYFVVIPVLLGDIPFD